VAAGLAQRCELQVAYAIGVADPMSIMVDAKGTGNVPDEHLAELVGRTFSMRPAAIIRQLDLLRPIYQQTAAYGHFGRNEPDLAWERTDRLEDPKRAAAM